MNTRIGKALGSTVVSVLAVFVVTNFAVIVMRSISAHVPIQPLVFMFFLFLVPLICGICIASVFHKRDCPMGSCLVILAVLDILHVIFLQHHAATTKILSVLTNHYNLEATAFYLLYAILFYTGLLFGMGIGYLSWRNQEKKT